MNTEVNVTSDNDMKVFGGKLGHALRGGEVIELVGDVGAGKTTLVKGIAKGMGVDEDVQSPTFTISRVYATASVGTTGSALELAHYDFYRLTDPGILVAEIHETAHNSDIVTVIEWGEIVEGVLPEDKLTIHITSPTETSRVLHLEAAGQKSQAILEAIK